MTSQEFQVTLTVGASDAFGTGAVIRNTNLNLAVDAALRADPSAGLVVRWLHLDAGAANRVGINTASASGASHHTAGPDFSEALERSASFLTLTTRYGGTPRSAVFRGPAAVGVTSPDAGEPYRYTWAALIATIKRLASQIASDLNLGGDVFNPEAWGTDVAFTLKLDDGVAAPDPTTVDATAGGPYTVASGRQVQLNGGGTEQNPSGATTHAWSIRSGSGGSFVDASLEDPTFQAPALAQGDPDRAFTVRYSRTNNGVTDTAEARITVTAPDAPAPAVEPMTVAWDTPASDGGAAITGFNVLLYPLLGLPSVADRIILLSVLSANSATTRAVEVDVAGYDDGGLFQLYAEAANGPNLGNVGPAATVYGRIPRPGDARVWGAWGGWEDVGGQIPIRNNPGDDAAEAAGALSRYGAGLIKSGSILPTTEEALGQGGLYGTITHAVESRPLARGGTNLLTQVFIPQAEEASYYNRDRSFAATDAQANWTHRVPLTPVTGRNGGTLDHVYRDQAGDLILVKVADASSVHRSEADRLTYSAIGGVPDLGSGRGTLRQYGFVETVVGNQAHPEVTQRLYVVTSTGFYRNSRRLA